MAPRSTFLAVLYGDLGCPSEALGTLGQVPAGGVPSFMAATVDTFRQGMQADGGQRRHGRVLGHADHDGTLTQPRRTRLHLTRRRRRSARRQSDLVNGGW